MEIKIMRIIDHLTSMKEGLEKELAEYALQADQWEFDVSEAHKQLEKDPDNRELLNKHNTLNVKITDYAHLSYDLDHFVFTKLKKVVQDLEEYQEIKLNEDLRALRALFKEEN